MQAQEITQENRKASFEGNVCQKIFFQDSLDSIGWAAAFIWAGVVVFLALNFGLGEQGWSLFFLGAGVCLVVLGIYLRRFPIHLNIIKIWPVFGDLIWAAILFALGTGWGLIWPLILIAIGVSILKDINSSRTWQ